MKHKKGLLWLLVLPLIPLVVFMWKLTYPLAYLPHKHIVIGLPYRLADIPTGIIPMGETIYHPKPKVPHGHPGIDFGWTDGVSHDMVAATNGKISWMKQGASEPGKWDLEYVVGAYAFRYKEMEDVAPSLKVGSVVKQGDLIGHAGHYCDTSAANGGQHCWFNIHWEFASRSTILDRFCPTTYFDTASRASIEAIWATIPSTDKIKSKFPDLCSGDYAGKVE